MSDPLSAAAYWSSVAREKTFTHPFRAELFAEVASRDAKVLDLGCGYGRLTAELHRSGWTRTIGADSAEGMIQLAREQHPDLAFTQLSKEALPWKDGAFDAVLLFSVLTCVPDTSEQDALLSEVARVLCTGGALYVSDLLLQTDARNRARYDNGLQRFGVHGTFELDEGVRLRHFDPDRLRDLFAGFERISFEERSVVTMNGNDARGFQFLGRKKVLRRDDAGVL